MYRWHIFDFGEDVERPKRVHKGSVEEILLHIRTRKRFSVFWATETAKRARTITRLVKMGIIIVDSIGYPWSSASIDEEKAAALLGEASENGGKS